MTLHDLVDGYGHFGRKHCAVAR